MAFFDFRCNSGFYFIYVKSYRVIISKCLMLFDCIHKIVLNISLLEKCPYSELFWSIFSCIRTEYEEYFVYLCIQSKCGKIWTTITANTDTFYAVSDPEYDPSGNSIFFVPRWSRYFKFIVCI